MIDGEDVLERTRGRRPPPVLVSGEHAAERTRLAHWIHAQGARASRPLLIVDCHEPDVAVRMRAIFRAAEGATVLCESASALDEKGRAALAEAIDDTSLDVCVIATTRFDEHAPLSRRTVTLHLTIPTPSEAKTA